MAVVGGSECKLEPLPQFVFPCGICRQVIAEFADISTIIIVAKSKSEFEVYKFSELFPNSFSKNDL